MDHSCEKSTVTAMSRRSPFSGRGRLSLWLLLPIALLILLCEGLSLPFAARPTSTPSFDLAATQAAPATEYDRAVTAGPPATALPRESPVATGTASRTPVPATQTAHATPATPATRAAPTLAPDTIAAIDDRLATVADEGRFSGAALIAWHGEVVLSKAYGQADREAGVPNTVQTPFRIGSVTKQFTAMAILMLQEQGKLNVHDKICAYIADCPAAWEPITIHHLLTHTSGMHDPGIPAWTWPSTPAETIARIKDYALDFTPGDRWAYCNAGYVVLGYIIEQVSGQSYSAFIGKQIFAPLGMTDSGYWASETGFPVGYDDATARATYKDPSVPHAAGALYSTVEDLYRWDQALATEQLLPAAALASMFAPYTSAGDLGSGLRYAYGWVLDVQWGHEVVFHPGQIDGFAAMNMRLPGDGGAIILLSNQANTDVTAFATAIAGTLIQGQ